jgi:ClpP class serine protease
MREKEFALQRAPTHGQRMREQQRVASKKQSSATEGSSPSGKVARVELIKRIQKARETSVITYVTSTRQNLEVHMALDVVRYVFDHLESIKKAHKGKGKPKIDLFLHSNGGDGTMPWRLVTLIREYTDHFSVLVPHRAFSAATLTALGADEVVMHAMGMLGPTDATVANAFNPIDPANPQRKLGISVEDVTAYIQLIKDDAGIQHEDELIQAFKVLATNVHPLALGNVKRSMSQSRMMARKLLELHMDANQRHKMDEIVDNLTSKLFFHGHPINRTEAVDQIGLGTVKNATPEVETAMWDLYLHYEKEMKLLEPFDPAIEFGRQHDIQAMAIGASVAVPAASNIYVYVESEYATNVSSDKYVLQGTKQPNGALAVTIFHSDRGWKVE